MLEGMEFKNLPDRCTMSAITFCDVIISHQQFTNELLFHELVHVEQYHQLGIARFAELYVRGFLAGASYEAIPWEVSADTLERRFRCHPRHLFSVQAEVKRCLARMALESTRKSECLLIPRLWQLDYDSAGVPRRQLSRRIAFCPRHES
jgi:hypothetical protein